MHRILNKTSKMTLNPLYSPPKSYKIKARAKSGDHPKLAIENQELLKQKVVKKL